MFTGYEISPQAFNMCKKRQNERIKFKLKDLLSDDDVFFDLLLVMDVIEHIEDYFSLLRGLKKKSMYKILNIPLELVKIYFS